jgi:hypothetical protein
VQQGVPVPYTPSMETERKPQKPGGAVKKAKAQARILILVAAFLSLVASVVLYFAGNELEGIFIGLWVPSILALGALLVPAGRD